MKWAELSEAASSVLERCFGLYDDKPRTFYVSVGDTLKAFNKEYVITEEVAQEIERYSKEQEQEMKNDFWFCGVDRTGDKLKVYGIDKSA